MYSALVAKTMAQSATPMVASGAEKKKIKLTAIEDFLLSGTAAVTSKTICSH
jgi:hypothetical protein